VERLKVGLNDGEEPLATDCMPLFLTDGLKDYGTAILAHFGYWIQPERR
jgi:hypothetical protein